MKNSPLKLSSNFILFIGQKFNGLARRTANKLYQEPKTIKDKGWVKFVEAGGEILRDQYELNEHSIVFDLGGYEGEFSSNLFSRYQSHFYIFEVFTDYANNIQKRFQQNKKIKVFPFGLGARDEAIQISIDDASTSSHQAAIKTVSAKLLEAVAFIKSQEIENIDLMKINIEGGEYELLEHLIETGMISRIDNIQVQFHDFVPDAYERMKKLHQKLSPTHQATYQFDFIWENWKRK